MTKQTKAAEQLQKMLLDGPKTRPECTGVTTIEVSTTPHHAERKWDAIIVGANSIAVQISEDCQCTFYR